MKPITQTHAELLAQSEFDDRLAAIAKNNDLSDESTADLRRTAHELARDGIFASPFIALEQLNRALTTPRCMNRAARRAAARQKGTR